ncbi:MAG TPA: VWA domain-containing protein [Actinomycetota bacterium]
MSGAYRYGPWRGGPDPLEPPFDLGEAMDRLGERVLAGQRPGEALNDLLRKGMPGLRGLRDLLRQARDRRRELLRERGRLGGVLDQVRELLDRALDQERQALFPDPSDAARLAEAELDQLPADTARAVRQLADYQWRSPEAAATYEEIRDLLRREVLDTRFRGMRDALRGATSEQLQRVRDMLGELNAMLEADARGEDTSEQFQRFMQRYGDFFPENPQTLDELIDVLARRSAAASRLLASLSPEQREELAGLMQAAMGDLGLEYELSRLGQALRSRRPDLRWGERAPIGGQQPLGLADATTALEELADLEALEDSLAQDYPGASLDDVDLDAVQRALGERATADVEALRALERELTEQGYLTRDHGRLRLTPKAIRRIGAAALQRIFRTLEARDRGDHEIADAGLAGEPTGSSRPWNFGDEQPLDVVRTVKNAVLRQGPATAPGRPRVTLTPDDFEVLDTERRSSAAVCLLIDLSYSMVLRDAWGAAKTTALALHSLSTSRFPQDELTVIGFSAMARTLPAGELAELEPDMVQGTNLQHALLLARRWLARRPEAEPVVLLITDGEPTAHLEPDGVPWFQWPPLPRTLELTLAEVLRLTKQGITINVFMLDSEPRLVRFVQALARLNHGRVFSPATDRLGDYVVSDYLRARRGRRRSA